MQPYSSNSSPARSGRTGYFLLPMVAFALIIGALALIPRSEAAVSVGAEGSGTNEPAVAPAAEPVDVPDGDLKLVPPREVIGKAQSIKELTEIAHASPKESRWEIGSDESGAALGWTSGVFAGADGPTPIFSYENDEFVGFFISNLPGIVTYEQYTDPGFDLEALAVERWGKEKYDEIVAHVTEREEQERKVLDGRVNEE